MKNLLKNVLLITASLTLTVGCANDNNAKQKSRGVSALTIEKVTTDGTDQPSSYLISTSIDSTRFDIPFDRADIGKRVQNYAGAFFYDLQSKCGDAACSFIAVALTVRRAGGSPEEITAYAREYFKLVSQTAEIKDRLKSNGQSFEDANLDDYLLGRL